MIIWSFCILIYNKANWYTKIDFNDKNNFAKIYLKLYEFSKYLLRLINK